MIDILIFVCYVNRDFFQFEYFCYFLKFLVNIYSGNIYFVRIRKNYESNDYNNNMRGFEYILNNFVFIRKV